MQDLKKKVILFQELSNNAWPAKSYQLLNGWILRFSEGVTSRANSVLPLHYSGTDVGLDIQIAENAYLSHQLPPCFMIPDFFAPSDLKRHLKFKNYQQSKETSVMEAPIENILKMELNDSLLIKSFSFNSKEWFSTFLSCSNFFDLSFNKKYAKILDRINLPKQFFLTKDKGKPVGVVLAVLERNHLGILDLVVEENFRQMGIATSLLFHAAKWGESNGAQFCYLQVVKENLPAISLYRKMDFHHVFSYFYMNLIKL